MLAGNALPEGAEPIAQAYAGHQFGGWSPQLGDGRAILLGRCVATDGTTPRHPAEGCGPHAVLAPRRRTGLGRAGAPRIPRLRGDARARRAHHPGAGRRHHRRAVQRETRAARRRTDPRRLVPHPGRHLPVLRARARIRRRCSFWPTMRSPGITRRPRARWACSTMPSRRRRALVAHWMSLGFIHGVMNTDNAHVGGETIDYGPCAFMDGYHPDTVFSSIDQYGRYAYANQPQIALWNLAQFASAPAAPDRRGHATPRSRPRRRPSTRSPLLYQAEWLSRLPRQAGPCHRRGGRPGADRDAADAHGHPARRFHAHLPRAGRGDRRAPNSPNPRLTTRGRQSGTPASRARVGPCPKHAPRASPR